MKLGNSILCITLGSLFAIGVAQATPVRDIAGLDSITFWERTGGTGPTAYTFDIAGPELTTYLSDPLSLTNSDMVGVPTGEFYDVYYSDADGAFDIDGEFLSISGVWNKTLPAGGGLNLAEIELNFLSDPGEFGNYVASYVALGDNAHPELVGNAIDGDLLTHTTMGNTVGESGRLRLTLGFLSSSGPVPPVAVPEPASALLFGGGLLGFGLIRRRQLKED